MWAEVIGDRVGLGDRERGNGAPLGAAMGQGSCDVEVDVRDGLVRRDAVVLPDSHTLRIERTDDGLRSRGRPRP